jgi:hypothetical protein
MRRTNKRIGKFRAATGMASGRGMGEWGNAPKKPGRSKVVPRITGVRRKGYKILITGTDLDKIRVEKYNSVFGMLPAVYVDLAANYYTSDGSHFNFSKNMSMMRVDSKSSGHMLLAPVPEGDTIRGSIKLISVFNTNADKKIGHKIDAPALPATIQFDMIHAPGIAPRKPARKGRMGRRRYSGKTYPYISTSGKCGPGEKAQPVIGFGSVLCHSPKMTVKPSRPPKITASAKKPGRKRRSRRTRI